MKKLKILQEVDKANINKKGTQFAKNIKIRESTYDLLGNIMDSDSSYRSRDDVIVALITIAALVANQDKG